MAIEDKRYEEVVQAVNALMATARHDFVKNALCGLAITILRHYSHIVTEDIPGKPKD